MGGTNDAPECVDEAVSVEAGSTVSTESQAKLLANDTGPETNDILTIERFRLGTEQESNVEFRTGQTCTGQYGRMTIESDGSYTYVADQTASKRLLTGETRTETFTYRVLTQKPLILVKLHSTLLATRTALLPLTTLLKLKKIAQNLDQMFRAYCRTILTSMAIHFP